MSFRAKRGISLLILLALSACATLPPQIPEVAECQANYLGIDERVDAADARNGGAHAIEGFPYLRSDRFLASFHDEVGEGAAFDTWVERLRQLDLESRRTELRNLGWENPSEELAHLDRCGRDWAARDLKSAERRAQLRESAAVPDDYSLLRRTLGLYPLAVPFLNMGINAFNEDVIDTYKVPIPLLDARGRPMLWQPEPAVGAPSGATGRDALGIPNLSPAQWQQLAAAHAPTWQVETVGDFDRLGSPMLKGGEVAFDAARPVTHFLPAYTRFNGQVLVQLVYIAWFSERPKSAGFSYGGTLDGVVWRVTLDANGKPLLYDTIHACGCYHYYFLAQPLTRKEQGGFWQEPVLFPQEAPAERFAVRLQSATHYVRRLVPLAQAEVDVAEKHTYAMRDYAELLALPDGDGTRSLFCEDGLACGTERFERFFLWPAGIKSAGAMRQWGRHATSFVGRTHFDDPGMMDRLFEVEPSTR